MINRGRNHLDSWDDIQFVLAVARTGSFMKAGERLSTNQSTVGRRIQRLERRLGAKLFDRHSHGMKLTPAGAALVARGSNLEAAINEIECHLAGSDQKMIGSVRIVAPEGVSTYWLTPTLLDYQFANPGLCIESIAGTGPVDLLAREADIAIHLFNPRQDRYVASKVGHLYFSLFAHRRYVDRFGAPEDIAQLDAHRLIDYLGYQPIAGLKWWRQFISQHHKIVFRASTTSVYVAAVRAGYGIGLFANFYRIVDPDLVQALDKGACGRTLMAPCALRDEPECADPRGIRFPEETPA